MRTLTISLMIFGLFLTGCKENEAKKKVEIDTPKEVKKQAKQTPDVADQGFVDGMTGAVWHQYLNLRMALTEGDTEAASTAAEDIANFYDKERPGMKSLAIKIEEAEDLEAQRKLFADFTEMVGPMFTEALGSGTIYKIHCPMAFNNKGADWYSDVPEVRNPYFGDRMLNCGKVVETFKPTKKK